MCEAKNIVEQILYMPLENVTHPLVPLKISISIMSLFLIFHPLYAIAVKKTLTRRLNVDIEA